MITNAHPPKKQTMKKRFSGYLPVVIDIETGGTKPQKHPLLEIAALTIQMNEQGIMSTNKLFACHVLPFDGSILDPAALEINRIDPYHPFRFAIDEKKALINLFEFINQALAESSCRRAVLVGHNAHFDLSFIQAAMKRCKITTGPLHAFTCFDTATLSGMVFGKTILAKALQEAHIPFNKSEAHSAIYDAERTAELFCYINNSCLKHRYPRKPAINKTKAKDRQSIPKEN